MKRALLIAIVLMFAYCAHSKEGSEGNQHKISEGEGYQNSYKSEGGKYTANSEGRRDFNNNNYNNYYSSYEGAGSLYNYNSNSNSEGSRYKNNQKNGGGWSEGNNYNYNQNYGAGWGEGSRNYNYNYNAEGNRFSYEGNRYNYWGSPFSYLGSRYNYGRSFNSYYNAGEGSRFARDSADLRLKHALGDKSVGRRDEEVTATKRSTIEVNDNDDASKTLEANVTVSNNIECLYDARNDSLSCENGSLICEAVKTGWLSRYSISTSRYTQFGIGYLDKKRNSFAEFKYELYAFNANRSAYELRDSPLDRFYLYHLATYDKDSGIRVVDLDCFDRLSELVDTRFGQVEAYNSAIPFLGVIREKTDHRK